MYSRWSQNYEIGNAFLLGDSFHPKLSTKRFMYTTCLLSISGLAISIRENCTLVIENIYYMRENGFCCHWSFIYLYLLPRDARGKYHTLSDTKQQKFLLLIFERRRLESRCKQVCCYCKLEVNVSHSCLLVWHCWQFPMSLGFKTFFIRWPQTHRLV